MLSHFLALSAIYHSYILAYYFDQPIRWVMLLVTLSVGYFTLGRDKVIVLFCLVSVIPFIYHSDSLQKQEPFPYDRFVLELRLEAVNDSIQKEWGTKTPFIVDDVLSCGALDKEVCAQLPEKKLDINDYGGQGYFAGDRVIGRVVLKPVLGFLNPGGFDYEYWMFTRAVWAKGYFKGETDVVFSAEKASWATRLSRFLDRLATSNYKENNQDAGEGLLRYSEIPERGVGVLKALILGDRSVLDSEDRSALAQSGLIHLFVISGLHIGLLFGSVFLCLKMLLVTVTARINMPILKLSNMAACASLITVAWYVDQIGYPIPALRALLFLAIWVFARLIQLEISIYQVLSLAMFLILSLFPEELFSFGFWMSFLAVFALSLSFVGVPHFSVNNRTVKPVKKRCLGAVDFEKWKHWGSLAIRAQVFVFLMLFPLVTALGTQANLLALLWNLVCIPVFGVVVVPLLMMASSLFEILPDLSALMFNGLAVALIWFLDQLILVNSLIPPLISIRSSSAMTGLLLAAVLLLLMPVARIFRFFAIVIIALLVSVAPAQKADLDVWFLDVGQALSIVFIKDHKAFIYDTGFAYGGFNAADSVIIPFLRNQNVEGVELVVVSHKDLDHSGGMLPLVKSQYSPKQILQNFSEHPMLYGASQRCGRSVKFEWQGLSLQGLWPPAEADEGSGLTSNDSSCVLLLDYQGEQILLTGDITRGVESQLMNDYPKLFNNVVLMSAPHHGSKSSSSSSFIQYVDPEMVVVSSGPLNRFGHPHQDVVNRYKSDDIRVFETARLGAIHFAAEDGGALLFKEAFLSGDKPYWRTTRQAQ